MNKICNPQKVFNCNICNTKYSSKSSLCNHNRIKHNVTLLCNNTGIMENLINCQFCDRQFNFRNNRWKHENICKTKLENQSNKIVKLKELEIEKINAEKNKLKEEKNKLKEEKELIKLKIKLQNSSRLDTKTFKIVNKILMAKSYNKLINLHNNTTINNNIQNNISLIGFGKEELMDKLTNKDKKHIMNSGYLCLEKIIEITNVGNYNEFKNIVITNLKDNFAYQYNESLGYFVVVNKNNTINELICNRVMDIEAIYDELETANKIDDKTKKIIKRFLIKIEDKNKFTDEQENITYINYKDYKIHNIKILLYNNQDKITKDISLFISND